METKEHLTCSIINLEEGFSLDNTNDDRVLAGYGEKSVGTNRY
jgi:hypothetical protein